MPQSSQDSRAEYITGLRKLADWLEQNTETSVPSDGDILLPLTKNEAVEAHAAATGLEVRYDNDGNASAVAKFGAIAYRAYGYADWDQHYAQHQEQTARNWADKNDMVIQPREGGAR
ncbi:hypothetical protein ACFWD7_48095 [Streptomyces mirabilis]|uniref:hypothetical protein n=1 Tax=Streptomyces mirabilis TaxID=68239 RepID=UPI0036A699A2